MHFRQAVLIVDNKTHTLLPGRANSFDEIYADFQNQPESGGERWSVFLHPKQDVTIQRLEIQFDLQLSPGARFFASGFQSWSESRLYGVNEAIPQLRSIARKYMGLYGDDLIPGIPHGRGYLHSWTYTYIRQGSAAAQSSKEKGPSLQFFGSLNESTGFTLFLYDHPNGILTVRKDMRGLQLSHSFPALDFWAGEGGEQEVFDRYFQTMGIAAPAAPPAIGWTSWYRYFNEISEEIILRNLEPFAAFNRVATKSHVIRNADLQSQGIQTKEKWPAYFQIDDGWQTATGDWLSAKPSFPQGMGYLAQKIREQGLLPGLWLAPFVAAKGSDLVKKHPEWLLRDAKGRLLKVGWNPVWGGWYYALDFYNNEVRNHLGGILHTILDRWGYELVKLDFLFAACLAPPSGKTRGQVMFEAMEFLRKLAGSKKILAGGVPLGSAFGLADFCRIGGDVYLAWEHSLLSFLRFRERVGALASLRATLGRWQLDGRAFRNDPDVFILRNETQKLTPCQQQTILTINALLGSLFFTSDDPGAYSPEQMAELEGALDLRGSRIIAVGELKKDVYEIEFENSGERYRALCNLTKRACIVAAGGQNHDSIELQAFESIIIKAEQPGR